MDIHRSFALRGARRTALALALAGLVACGSDAGTPAAEPSPTLPPASPAAPSSDDPASDDPASENPAGGTRPAAISPADALTFDEPMPLVVQGWLRASDGSWQLCGVALESYPPQCSEEDSLTITNPAAISETDLALLEEASGVRWSEGSVVYAGERRGTDGFQITGPPDAGSEGLIGGDAAAGGDGPGAGLSTPEG